VLRDGYYILEYPCLFSLRVYIVNHNCSSQEIETSRSFGKIDRVEELLRRFGRTTMVMTSEQACHLLSTKGVSIIKVF
jgi:hypothetical protein